MTCPPSTDRASWLADAWELVAKEVAAKCEWSRCNRGPDDAWMAYDPHRDCPHTWKRGVCATVEPIDTLDALDMLRDITGLTWRLEARDAGRGGARLAVYESRFGHPSCCAASSYRQALRTVVAQGVAESEAAFSEGRSFIVYTQNTPEQRAALRALLRRMDAAGWGA